MYDMAQSMDIDMIGRPGEMGTRILPTMVPTLQTYQNLMRSADGSWAGWGGVLLGYSLEWVVFTALIAALQLGLLFASVVDMLGIAKSPYLVGGLLIVVGLFQFSRTKDVCHRVCKASDAAYNIEMLEGACEDHPVMVSNSKYWMGPDTIAAVGLKSKVRDFGRVWDFGGKFSEICPIDWKGAKG